MRPLRLLQRVHEPLRRPPRTVAAAVLAVALVVALDGAAGLIPAAASPVRPAPAGLAVQPASPADTFESPGETDRVSFETDGSQLGAASSAPAISADGRFVVYRTVLMTPSGIDVGRILLRDRAAGTTTEVARGGVTAGIALAVSAVSAPTISGDGRWVAFVAGNPDPASNARTVVLWDSTTGALTRPLSQLVGWADQPALSGDGRYLAFRSAGSPNSAVGGFTNVFVADLVAGGLDRVSTAFGGKGGYRGNSSEPAISSDGRFVAFTSNAAGLVSGSVPVGQTTQVYLRDRTAATVALVSVRPDGSGGTASSSSPSISAAGDAVAFASSASDLVAGDTNGVTDAFVWTASTGVTRVSVTSEGAQASGASAQPSISGDGSVVAFASLASDLVPGDTNGSAGSLSGRIAPADIFVHLLASGRTARISIGPGPVEANGSSLTPSTDGDGGVVAFSSAASNLVSDDTNGVSDVFVRVRPAGIAISPDPTDFGTLSSGAAPGPHTVTITSTGLVPLAISGITIAGPSALSFAVLADGCTGLTLAPGATCQVSVGVSAVTAGQLKATIQVADNAPGAPHSAGLTALVLGGAGAPPKIKISPVVGPTGTVVTVTGAGFGAGQPVKLTWSVGITPTPLSPITAAPDGSLNAQVLVLPNDVLGPRTLSAVSVVSGVPGIPATAKFLAVTATAQPPTSTLVRVAIRGFERPMVWRR